MVVQRLPVDHDVAISEISSIDVSCAKSDVAMSHMAEKNTFFIKKRKKIGGESIQTVSHM